MLLAAAALAACAGAPAPNAASAPVGTPVGDAGGLAAFRVEPPPAPAAIRRYVGRYGGADARVFVLERDGRLFERADSSEISLDRAARDTLFRSGPGGVVSGVSYHGRFLPREVEPTEGGEPFRIVPLLPVDSLRALAVCATPPAETGKREPDLVEPTLLDPSIRLDVRYATDRNFMGAPFYAEERAFLQRPAADALLRVSRSLAPLGYGLLIHDAYRPWYVTKMFWDATPPAQRDFVANPANGSRHNRGAAVDLTLYDLETGKPVAMPSGYDEFTERAGADYPGGTTLERFHRALLRTAMEREGFEVYPYEWWHFDYRGWRDWPILNEPLAGEATSSARRPCRTR